MKPTKIVLLLVALACVLGPTAALSIYCPPGTYYDACGSACNTDCSNYQPDGFCIAVCVQGCFCPKGLLKKRIDDFNVECVSPDQCDDSGDEKCPGGQVYSECAGCRATCDNPHPICAAVCVPGCTCPHDFPIWDGSQCVKECKPHDCPGGQVYTHCGGCQPTCDNPFPICPLVCIPGCKCPPEFPLWDGSKCVKECKKKLPCPVDPPFCNECNECKECAEDGPTTCTEIACIDPERDFEKLLRGGCWRKCGDLCRFTFPCPDPDYYEPSCATHDAFCKDCNMCTCQKTPWGLSPVCSVNIVSCETQLEYSLSTGCWVHAQGQCRFIVPCPPIPERCGGCWVKRGDQCRHVYPCPDDVIRDGKAGQMFCEREENHGNTFCFASDCNLCFCAEDGSGSFGCTDMACAQPQFNGMLTVGEDGECEYIV